MTRFSFNILLLSAGLCWYVFSTATYGDQNVPVLRVRLGEPVSDVKKNSTVPFDSTEQGGSSVILTLNHTFIYDEQGSMFTVPGLRFLGITESDERVSSINEDSMWMTLDAAVDSCRELVKQIDSSGWKRVSQDKRSILYSYPKSYSSLDSLHDAFVSSNNPITSATIAAWTNSNGDHIRLDLIHKGEHGEPLPILGARPNLDLEDSHYIYSLDIDRYIASNSSRP